MADERSTTENIKDLANASKQLLDSGRQVKDNLGELSERIEHASDVGTQIFKSPWFLAGSAVLAGTLLITLGRRH